MTINMHTPFRNVAKRYIWSATIRDAFTWPVGQFGATTPSREAGRTRSTDEETMVSGTPFSDVRWRKSSVSGMDGCLEIARSADGAVLLRDSKDPAGAVLQLTEREWTAFTAGLKAGEFDDV